jgi:hypothetical protein
MELVPRLARRLVARAPRPRFCEPFEVPGLHNGTPLLSDVQP